LYPSRKTAQGGAEATDRKQSAAAREAASDNVAVSANARLLSAGRNALAREPQLRGPVVEAAREKLGDSPEAFDGRKVARAMIDTIAETEPASDDQL
jgi:hypothetical protein